MTDPIRVALERLIARLDETTDPNGPVPAWSDSFYAARAALAHPAPPAEGEVGEVAAWLRAYCSEEFGPQSVDPDASWLNRAAELLQQRHPEPVPVSERLPGPEDCTTNPRNGRGQWCWGWVQHDQPPYSGRWRMMLREWLSDEAVA